MAGAVAWGGGRFGGGSAGWGVGCTLAGEGGQRRGEVRGPRAAGCGARLGQAALGLQAPSAHLAIDELGHAAAAHATAAGGRDVDPGGVSHVQEVFALLGLHHLHVAVIALKSDLGGQRGVRGAGGHGRLVGRRASGIGFG